MKSQAEIFQALLDGKTVKHKIWGRKVSLADKYPIKWAFDKPEDWEIYDKWSDLKKAYEEGALIQFKSETNGDWFTALSLSWNSNIQYRIKDGISIEFWNKWKTLIKAFWEGKTLQYRYDNDWRDWQSETMPKDFDRMRIKPEPVLYFRWKCEEDDKVYVSTWFKKGTQPTDGSNWIRIEPGKTFEEIE